MCRFKLETLADKETGQLEEEEEEEKKGGQGGADDSQPASLPQPVPNQVLLEDEDLIIEEYISD